jgi:hypothetical protein
MTARYRDCIDRWFNELYPLYRTRWHPAVAAIEAHMGARRRCRPVTA